jgi:hypothetical protein
MSIQGIRRIREGKVTSPERTIRVQINRSKDRSNFFAPINIVAPVRDSPKAGINSGPFEMTRSAQHPVYRHRKTGSLGFNGWREQDYYDMVSNQL